MTGPLAQNPLHPVRTILISFWRLRLMSSVSSASFTLSDPFATQPVPAPIIMFERFKRFKPNLLISRLMPSNKGVLRHRLAPRHVFGEDFAHFVFGQRDIFHRRFAGEFDRGHRLLAAEARA